MPIENRDNIGLVLNGRPEPSRLTSLWMMAGGYGAISQEEIDNIVPDDYDNQDIVAQEIAEFGYDGKDRLWVRIDPTNIYQRNALAFARGINENDNLAIDNLLAKIFQSPDKHDTVTFQKYCYKQQKRNRDILNMTPTPSGAMKPATEKPSLTPKGLKRARETKDPKQKKKVKPSLQEEPEQSPGPSRQSPANNDAHAGDMAESEIPGNIQESDEGMRCRAANRVDSEQMDRDFGRFVVRCPKEITAADVRALEHGGPNNLIELAAEYAHLRGADFINAMFKGWNTSLGPGDPPQKAVRVGSDSSVVCGLLKEDIYTQVERAAAKKAGRRPSEMGFGPRTAHARAGATVRLKVRPGTNAPHVTFVNSKHHFVSEDMVTLNDSGTYGDFLRSALTQYDIRDAEVCDAVNEAMLVWLARRRLHQFYTLQPATPWNEPVAYDAMQDEEIFRPILPARTCIQQYGLQHGTSVMNTAAIGLLRQPVFAPKVVNRNGIPNTVSERTRWRLDQQGEMRASAAQESGTTQSSGGAGWGGSEDGED